MDTIDDVGQYHQVLEAMKTVELEQSEQDDLFKIVASVLHMGNVGFTEDEGVAQILKPASVEAVASVSSFGRSIYLNFFESFDAADHNSVLLTNIDVI